MTRPTPARWLLGLAVIASVPVVLVQTDAQAACRVAGFVEAAVEVDESAGTVTLTVELVDTAVDEACEGAVRYFTVDGSARSPDDFGPREGVLCFRTPTLSRTIDIDIVDDGFSEEDETFTVRLVDADVPGCQPDALSANGEAVVTILDGDPAGETSDNGSPSPASSAVTTPSGEPPASAEPEPTPDTDPPSVGATVVGIGIVVVLGVAGFLLGRRTWSNRRG